MKKWAAVFLLALTGCGVASVPGDPFWICCDNEAGRPQQIRDGSDLGDEIWAEWWTGGAWKPWCRIAFDRADWLESSTGARAKWIKYDLSAGATGLRVR